MARHPSKSPGKIRPADAVPGSRPHPAPGGDRGLATIEVLASDRLRPTYRYPATQIAGVELGALHFAIAAPRCDEEGRLRIRM